MVLTRDSAVVVMFDAEVLCDCDLRAFVTVPVSPPASSYSLLSCCHVRATHCDLVLGRLPVVDNMEERRLGRHLARTAPGYILELSPIDPGEREVDPGLGVGFGATAELTNPG